MPISHLSQHAMFMCLNPSCAAGCWRVAHGSSLRAQQLACFRHAQGSLSVSCGVPAQHGVSNNIQRGECGAQPCFANLQVRICTRRSNAAGALLSWHCTDFQLQPGASQVSTYPVAHRARRPRTARPWILAAPAPTPASACRRPRCTSPAGPPPSPHLHSGFRAWLQHERHHRPQRVICSKTHRGRAMYMQ